jgi:peptidoglycan hydrolase-like protein with peptidoglycan-binding domain
MVVSLRFRLVSVALIAAMASGPAAVPQASAQSSLEQQLLGLGAAVILNQMNRSQQDQAAPQQQRQQQQTQQTPSAPRQDPARLAAMELQRNLNALGFDAGPVDGVPGARTRTAIQAYQVSRGFPATGSLNAMQRLAMETEVLRQASGGVETAELRRANMLEMQTYLRELGYNPGTPDGAWGPRSQAALDAFRRDAGLSASNTPVNPGDSAALYARVHGVQPVGQAAANRFQSAQGMAPSPAVQSGPSFDCARAGTPTERAICANPRLSALDRQLASAWSEAVAAAGGSAALLPQQQAWLAGRNACGADVACLDQQMASRVIALTGAAPAPTQPVPGGGFAVATFGADGLSQPGGAAPSGFGTASGAFGTEAGGFGTASFTAAAETTPAAGNGAPSAGLPAIGGGGWVHAEGARFLRAPESLAHRLMLAEVRLDPSILSNDNAVLRMLTQERAQQTGRNFNEVNRELANLNAIERQDAIAQHRARILAEAQAQPDLTPASAIPLAVYLTPPGSNRYGNLEYVEGRGINLGTPSQLRMALPSRDSLGGSFYLSMVLPGIDLLPMSRDQASAFLNSHADETAQRRRLVQVVWGRLTRLGIDETVADFASSNTGTGFSYQGTIPTTFVPERVTLHYLDPNQGRETTVVTAATPVLYEWTLGGTDDAPQGQLDALALARDLGLPIQDGHVLAGQIRNQQGGNPWVTFNNLAWVGANPDVARETDAFAAVAGALLSDVDRRAFFGERQIGVNLDLQQYWNPENPQQINQFAANAFADEFLRRDAKRAFLDRYYDGILARAPKWPLPLLHKVSVRLGEYDFDTQSFPIIGLDQQQFRVAGTVGFTIQNGNRQGLYSVDRFGNLPDRLPMAPDQARMLRDMLRAANPYGDDSIVLAWWSDLDMGQDATAIENLLNPNRPLRANEARPGRATLKRVALFLDEGLNQPLLEIDPEAVLMPNPEPAEADSGVAASVARIGSLPRATGPQLLAAVARATGDDAIWDRLARTQTAVQQANEFDAPGAVAAAVADMKGQPDGPIWLEGTATLSEYDLASGSFAFTEGSGYVRFSLRGDTGSTSVTPNLVGNNPFQTLPVAQESARAIVEADEPGRRRVNFLLRATPQGVVDKSHPSQVDTRPSFELLLQPQEVIFWRNDRQGAPTEILAALSYEAENAELQTRLDRRFDPTEFEGLAAVQPMLDPHVMDLLILRNAGGETPTGETLDAMLVAAWQHEQSDAGLPGPRFFDAADALPTGPDAELLKPALASYLDAKAQALGQQFVLDLPRGQQQAVCNAAIEPGAIYGGGRPVFDALPQSRDDANLLGQRLREEPGAFEVARRYGLFQQRSSARYGNCEQWFAFVVLEDAVHEGKSVGNATVARIAFTLNSVQLFEGANPVPDMILRGRADATRLVGPDGQVGDPVAPAPPPAEVVEEPAPADTPSQQDLTAAAKAVTPQTTPTPEAPAETVAEAWPDLPDFEAPEGGQDILGLRIGMSMGEAEQVILERGGVMAAYESPFAEAEERETQALAYRRVYITRDGTEALSVASYAPDGPVLALMRRMVLESGSLPYDRIEQALDEKYGESNVDGEALGMEGLRAWLVADDAPEAQYCAAVPFAGSFLGNWTRLDGIGDAGWTLPNSGRNAWMMGLPDYPPEMMAFTANCDQALIYTEEQPAIWGASGFSLVMVDFDAVRRASEALVGGAGTADLEIEF